LRKCSVKKAGAISQFDCGIDGPAQLVDITKLDNGLFRSKIAAYGRFARTQKKEKEEET
jgi:hypothetical protein